MKPEQLALYAITDRKWLGENTLEAQVESALKGGATMIQLREKELNSKEVLNLALKLKPICQKYQVPLILNDYVDLAIQADVDGVHVGQADTEALAARSKLAPDKILGVSCETIEQALEAEANGADYLGVGAVFPTATKNDAETISLTTLREIAEAVEIPVVAIGGIELGNISELKNTGISGVSVISAIFAAEDIEATTHLLKNEVQKIL